MEAVWLTEQAGKRLESRGDIPLPLSPSVSVGKRSRVDRNGDDRGRWVNQHGAELWTAVETGRS